MMKILKLLPLALLLLLTGCRSSQKAMEGTTPGMARSEMVYMEKVVANGQHAKAVTARMNMDLNAMGKNLSVNGKLRMKRNEVVQLSLTLLGFEVGRLEFTPQQVLVVDRVNKQYVRASYEDVSFLKQAELDFYALQSLFWNELFIPGQRDVAAGLSRFHYEETGGNTILSLTDAPKLKYTFMTQKEQAIVKNVVVQGKNTDNGAKLEWIYDSFVRLDNRYFPSFMKCKVVGLGKSVDFTLALSRLDNDEKWAPETQLSTRYKERHVEDILQQLMGM